MSVPTPADAIVVAAGRSSRMAGNDKLLAEVAGRPLLAWTLDAIAAAPEVARIVVVTAAERVDLLADADWLPADVSAVVAGGDRRQVSVAAGLAALDDANDDRVLLVHDGARPLVSPVVISAVVDATSVHGAAVPILPVTETLKRTAAGQVLATVDRTGLGVAQTPQGVRVGTLRSALARFPADGPETWTDEASLLEACGIAVHVVPGDADNLKVTVPADLVRAEAVIAGRHGGTVGTRVGIGLDSHPFGPGSGLALGGSVIADAPRLHGHSDGDVVLHAICDALLGAAGQGDLGRWFPAGPETPAGIDSRVMLADVRQRLADDGWYATGLDVTITAARPRLGPRLDDMRVRVADLLELPFDAVNVKASTGNLHGPDGAGRSISALAIATLGRRP